MRHIAVEQVQRSIAAGIAKARALNSPSSIAIIDAGTLIGFARMEQALLAPG
jgi:uncharacterized protein GlcG (DUF336 family)